MVRTEPCSGFHSNFFDLIQHSETIVYKLYHKMEYLCHRFPRTRHVFVVIVLWSNPCRMITPIPIGFCFLWFFLFLLLCFFCSSIGELREVMISGSLLLVDDCSYCCDSCTMALHYGMHLSTNTRKSIISSNRWNCYAVTFMNGHVYPVS